jgi:hypothetical protein
MGWTFAGNPVNVGETTGLLVFTSPFAPELDNITVASGLAGGSALDSVASPSDRLFQHDIPEPTSVVLIMACSVAAICTRKSR